MPNPRSNFLSPTSRRRQFGLNSTSAPTNASFLRPLTLSPLHQHLRHPAPTGLIPPQQHHMSSRTRTTNGTPQSSTDNILGLTVPGIASSEILPAHASLKRGRDQLSSHPSDMDILDFRTSPSAKRICNSRARIVNEVNATTENNENSNSTPDGAIEVESDADSKSVEAREASLITSQIANSTNLKSKREAFNAGAKHETRLSGEQNLQVDDSIPGRHLGFSGNDNDRNTSVSNAPKIVLRGSLNPHESYEKESNNNTNEVEKFKNQNTNVHIGTPNRPSLGLNIQHNNGTDSFFNNTDNTVNLGPNTNSKLTDCNTHTITINESEFESANSSKNKALDNKIQTSKSNDNLEAGTNPLNVRSTDTISTTSVSSPYAAKASGLGGTWTHEDAVDEHNYRRIITYLKDPYQISFPPSRAKLLADLAGNGVEAILDDLIDDFVLLHDDAVDEITYVGSDANHDWLRPTSEDNREPPSPVSAECPNPDSDPAPASQGDPQADVTLSGNNRTLQSDALEFMGLHQNKTREQILMLYLNSLGDAPFHGVHKANVVYMFFFEGSETRLLCTEGQWNTYRRDINRWAPDDKNLTATQTLLQTDLLPAVEESIQAHCGNADARATPWFKKLLELSSKLSNDNGRRDLIKQSVGIFTRDISWDSHPKYFMFKNVVWNEESNRFESPRPSLFIRRSSPVTIPAYMCQPNRTLNEAETLQDEQEKTANREWKTKIHNLIWSMFKPDIDRKNHKLDLNEPGENEANFKQLKRILRSLMRGESLQRAYYLFSPRGRQGKGTVMKMVKQLFGTYMQVSDECLFSAGKPNIESPSSIMLSYGGARVVYLSEVDEAKKMSNKEFKQKVSSDEVAGRRLFSDDNIEQTPTYNFLILSNNPPYFSCYPKNSERDRVCIQYMPRKFCDTPEELEREPVSPRRALKIRGIDQEIMDNQQNVGLALFEILREQPARDGGRENMLEALAKGTKTSEFWLNKWYRIVMNQICII